MHVEIKIKKDEIVLPICSICREGYVCNKCGNKMQKLTFYDSACKSGLKFYCDCIYV